MESSTVKEWKALNCDLECLCKALLQQLIERGQGDPVAMISGAFLQKAYDTLSAVNVLYANGLEEPAQVLIRVLFEIRVNFDCFLKMAHDDARGTCERVLHAMVLEKLKQARASDFLGFTRDMRENLYKEEEKIGAIYGAEGFARLRKHGFTGIPVEQRATLTGHEDAYSVVYRNFSRNVHATDYVESFLKASIMTSEQDAEYILSRDIIALYTTHFSAAGIAELTNTLFKLGFKNELHRLGLRQEAIKRDDDMD